MIELALHDLLELELKSLDGADVRATIGLLETVNVEGTLVDVSNVIVLEVHDLLGVLDNGRRIGGEEELCGHGHAVIGHESARLRAVEEALVRGTKTGAEEVVGGRQEVGGVLLESNVLGSGLGGEGSVLIGVLNVDKVDLHAALRLDTNDEGRTLTGSDNLVGVVNGLDQKTISTLKLLDNGLGQVGEPDLWVLVVDVLCELGDALGIGLGLKAEALALEQGLELLVVGNDTIVNDGELPVGVGPVGVAVGGRRRTVGSPTGVGNTGVGVEDLLEVDVRLVDELPQLGDLANLLEGLDLVLLVAIDGQTGGIIASVLEARETVDEGVENELAVLLDEVVDVTENATCRLSAAVSHLCCHGQLTRKLKIGGGEYEEERGSNGGDGFWRGTKSTGRTVLTTCCLAVSLDKRT